MISRKPCQCLWPKVKILLRFVLDEKTNSPNCLCKYIFAQSASHLSVLCSSLNFNTSGHFFLFARLSISGNTGVTQTCEVLRVRKKKIILTINRIPCTDKPTMKKIFDAGIMAVIKILLYC